MKTLVSNSFRFLTVSSVLLCCLLANRAKAAVTTWDPQGSTTHSPYATLHLDGTWENNSWSTSQSGQATPGPWVDGNAAVFAANSGTGTPAFTVTMNANHTVGGMFSGPLTWNPCTFTIQGTGTMLLPAGLQGFDLNSNTSDPGIGTINVVMADATPATPCEYTAEGSGQVYLNGINTWSGGTLLGYSGASFSGILYFNSSASFGTGGICISNTSTSIAALVAEGSSALTIPNNITNAASALPKLHLVAPSGGLTFSGEWDVKGQAQIGASTGPVYQTGVMKGAGGFSTLAGVSSPSSFALNGLNTFTGPVTNALGTLAANSIADSPTPNSIGEGTVLAFSGGTFQYTGASAATTTRSCFLTVASTIDLPAGNLELSGAFKSSLSTIQLTKTSAGTLTLSGSADNSSLAIKVNAGTVVLNKASGGSVHALGGASTVSGGTLQLGNTGGGGDQIFSGVILTVSSGAFDMNGQSESMTTLSLSGTGISSGGALVNSAATTTSTITGTAASGITLAANASVGGVGSITIPSGTVITGTKSLTYVGTATLTLSGANTYSGGTIVNNGTLLVNNASGSATGTSTVTVNSPGTLTGTGIISGATTVNAGGTLTMVDGTPGEVLTFGGNLGLAGTTSLEIEEDIGVADEVLSSGGIITLGGNLTVVQVDIGDAFVLGDTFQLFGGTLAGHFTSFTLPALSAGLAWDTSQLGLGGNGQIKVICDGTLAANAGANQAICFGSTATLGGSPTASGGSGVGTYTYSWAPATGLSSVTDPNPTATPTATTTYTLTVTDVNGCTAMSSVTVTAGTIAISSQPASTAVCDGSMATFSVTATGAGLSYSWANNNNGGWGSAWAATGSGSTWLGTSTDNNQGNPNCNSFSAAGDINSPVSGYALGMYGGTGGDEAVTRTFAALAAGQVASIDFDNGNVDNASKVGFSLQDSTGADVLQFYFVGGSANYKYWDTNAGEQDSGIPWTYTGLRVQFALVSGTTYGIIVTPCGGTPTTLTGSYSGTIAQVKLFNGNTAGGDEDNVYFNNFLIGGYSDNADNYVPLTDYATQDKGNQPIVSGNGNSTYTTPALSVANSGSQYQVTVYGCGGTVVSTPATVTVNPLPTVSVNSETVCAGASATLTATTSAATPSYLWSPGGATTAAITVSPASTTTYTVTVTDGVTGCANSGSGTVTVNPLPTVSVNSAAVCAGASATLTATTSASSPTYLWNDPDNSTTASITVSPATTTTYTVTVTDGVTGCANSGSGTVTVNPLPTVSVNSQTVCSATLPATTTATPAGGTAPYSYVWTVPVGQADPGNVASFGATVAGTYSVVVTDAKGCTGSGSGTLTINATPTVSVNSATVCAGGPATLTATTSAGTPSYLWSPGGATSASITVSPASTTTYTVTVTDGGTGCANSGSGTVTVNPLPTVSVNSAAVCAGGSATLTATTSASTPSYLWSPGGATTASITVSPASTTTYTVTVTDGVTGCANSGSGTVTVNPVPTAAAAADQTVCAGSPVEIGGSPTASGGTGPYTYLWAPATGLSDATVDNPTASVGSTTTYTVTVTDANGCTATASVTLTVPPLPNIESTTLVGSDVTLVWDSLAGQVYRVQYTTDLPNPPAAATWTDLTPDVTATGATATYTDTSVPPTQRFYRIFIVCP